VPTLAQVYEDHAAACTRAAEQCDDSVFRNMLISLALQWKQLTALVEMTTKHRKLRRGDITPRRRDVGLCETPEPTSYKAS
jgi:hypothetical protein